MGPHPRGKEEPRGRREREGSRGAGRARGAGRKRGGAAGGGSGKTPRLPARPSQEAGVGTPDPGSPSPTSGAPPVTSPRGHQVHCPWPRPASSPSAAGGGAGRGPGAEGLPGSACSRLSLASVFSSVKESKEKTRRGGARLSSQKLGSRDRRIVMSSKSAWAI